MWRTSRRKKTAQPPLPKKATRGKVKLTRSKVAQRRVKVRLLLASFFLITAVSIGGALSWVSFAPFLSASTVAISGNEDVSSRAIDYALHRETQTPIVGLFSRQNTILFPSAQLETYILELFPKIDSITIKSHPLQHNVTVMIVERQPYARWCHTNETLEECFLIDEDGFIFEKVATTTPSSLLFAGGVEEEVENALRTFIAPTYFEDVHAFLERLQVLDVEVTEFKFEDVDARITLKPHWELRVALDKDLVTTAQNLGAVLDEYNLRQRLDELNYIDMRFDERVYHTFNETADSSEE